MADELLILLGHQSVSRSLNAGGRALQERFLAGCQGLGPQAAEGERRLVPMCLP